MKDATITDALANERNSILKCKQHTIHNTRGPENYNYTMMYFGAIFYRRHTGTKHQL